MEAFQDIVSQISKFESKMQESQLWYYVVKYRYPCSNNMDEELGFLVLHQDTWKKTYNLYGLESIVWYDTGFKCFNIDNIYREGLYIEIKYIVYLNHNGKWNRRPITTNEYSAIINGQFPNHLALGST